jgi:hypothetical protein
VGGSDCGRKSVSGTKGKEEHVEVWGQKGTTEMFNPSWERCADNVQIIHLSQNLLGSASGDCNQTKLLSIPTQKPTNKPPRLPVYLKYL